MRGQELNEVAGRVDRCVQRRQHIIDRQERLELRHIDLTAFDGAPILAHLYRLYYR